MFLNPSLIFRLAICYYPCESKIRNIFSFLPLNDKMDNSFKSLLEEAKSILILLPLRPFFDQVAGGLGLYLALRESKEAAISSPSEMVVEFNRLVGVNKVTNELGNKNLVIKFSDYQATGIERVSYDIENGEFR